MKQKIGISTAILLLLVASCLGLPSNSRAHSSPGCHLIAQETTNKTKGEKEQEQEQEQEKKNSYATFSDLQNIQKIPDLITFLKEFISWKHWRYWLSLVAMAIIWFISILALPEPSRIFSKKNAERFREKENVVYAIMWVIYAALLAIFFTFAYDHLQNFLRDVKLLALPSGQHWIHWVLWSGLVILAIGAVVDILYNLIVFRLAAFYVLFSHVVQGVLSMVLVFLFTTLLTYMIIGIGIVIGTILAVIIGVSVIFAVLKGAGESLTSAGGGYSGSSGSQRSINEKERRARENRENFNRRSLENTRGW